MKTPGIWAALTLGLVAIGCSSKTGLICATGLTTCQSPGDGGGSVCVDTQNDPQNCGGCGMACGENAICALSACVSGGCGLQCGCRPLESACPGGDGGFCANLANDPLNCGTCGKTCPGGDLCAGGICVTDCPSGLTTCASDAGQTVCAFLPRDPQNCGACGVECSQGYGTCLLGGCYETRPPALPEPRWTLAAATDLDGGVYAIGGSDEFARNTSTVWRFTGDQAGWMPVKSLPTARSALAATTGKDGKIYVLGGVSGSVALGTLEAYDPGSDSWTSLPPMPTPRDWLAAATGTDGRIYAFGGQLIQVTNSPDGGLVFAYPATAVVEVYDPVSQSWSSAASMPTARSALAAVLGPDGAFYVMGGETDLTTLTDVVEALLPDGGWQTMPSLSSARAGLGAAIGPDGKIYAISGADSSGNVVSTVDVFDPAAGSWSVGSPLSTPRYGMGVTVGVGPHAYIFALGGGVTGPLSAVVNTVEVLVTQYGQWQ